ncbi:hypothetical protein [Marinobacter sp.]|uniref:hypothetical protein n=1 Tax=Marinobacter sp. TaxID=50741 RepID=UPI00262407DE|nr:hypothetical protein [Marinobacter sp.]
MDFETFRGSVQHLTREESLTFVRSNGLQTVFPEINETSPTELLIYPGALVITKTHERFSVTLGLRTLSSTSLRKLEKMIFFYGVEQRRLAA